MKNKKAEIIEIILITILISLSINLISSSIFALNEIKNIISELSTYDMEIPNLIEKIESGKAYKMSLKSKNKQLENF